MAALSMSQTRHKPACLQQPKILLFLPPRQTAREMKKELIKGTVPAKRMGQKRCARVAPLGMA